MPRLKSLLIASWIPAGIAFVPCVMVFFTERWFRFGVAFEIGLLCSAICLVIAVCGLWAYGRKGLWLLLPIIPAGFSLVIILAGLVFCLLTGGACMGI